MRVIICGAGQVGTGIARQLAREGNDVTVIDQSAELVQRIQDMLDVKGVIGHGAHPSILQRAGANESDMLIAVTYSDEVNMVAAQVAHSLFQMPTKIARVRAQSYLAPEWQDLFSRDNMPIDVIISPELEVARTILRRLEIPGAFETVDFADGHLQLVGVHLFDDCPAVNTPLNQLTELFPDLTAIVVAVYRNGNLFVPKTDDQLMVDDDVYFVAAKEHVSRTLDIFGHEEKEARRVVIVGGGNIGLFTAEALEKAHAKVKVRLIEMHKKRAEHAADRLSRTVVLNGSGLDQTILREAGVQNAETLIAVTNDDQVNILSSVIAKRMGCLRALTLINNQDYTPFLDTLGIDTFLDPRATTVSTILQHVRRGRIKRLYSVRGGLGEVVEAEALETSPLIGQPLREARLPDGVILGGIVRKGQVLPMRGDTEVLAGDRVVIFAKADMVRKVEQLFRVSLEYF